MSPHDYYQTRIETFEKELHILKKRSRLLSWIRLASFLAFVGLLIFFFIAGHSAVILTVSILALIGFALLVNRNLRLEDSIALLSYKIEINRNELRSLRHEYQQRESGDGFAAINPHLANDFDLFGNGSLYQYLNRCTTRSGCIAFATALCNQQKDAATILDKQAAIRELTQKIDFIQEFQANGMSTIENGHEAKALLAWLAEPNVKFSATRRTAVILAIVNTLWILLSALGIFTWGSLCIPLCISLAVVARQAKTIVKAHSQLNNIAQTFVKHAALFKLMEEESFASSHLCDLQARLSKNEHTASKSSHALFRILSLFDIRDNVVLAFILNAVFLLDIHVYDLLLKWRFRHNTEVSEWFSAISEMDILISLATYAFNNGDHVVFPTIAEDSFRIDATDMGHPLIHPGVRVNNSIIIAGSPSVQIITGANMAGKSTFLRTVVINLILAMNGAPVPATRFEFTPCDIMSSIKIQDSLSNNESYFYAELVRIKEIIEHVQQQPCTLVVLDEILRGTNTKDKQTGSLGLLKKLINLNTMVIIATHDLVIGELEQTYPSIVRNHCFEVELTDNQLFFDYKLKDGISKKLNASFLMRQMQIIE